MKKFDCIFLDRDGTLNPDPGYINNILDYNFYDFTLPALKMMCKNNNRFCIVTNQSGVARGLIPIKNLNIINDFIKKEFSANNISLLDIYMCFDHPNNASIRRKPGSGMFLEAKKEYNIKLSKCLMVGDSIIDMEAGKNLGMETMLVLTGKGKETLKNFQDSKCITYFADNIYEGFRQLCR
ncbi:MAG: D,D-heptose 1,7-bisphosphate phosphatase [Candidatus Marinimicrobia bacterium]|nr:D,D-heptose 1,7-bisphosphate phosphatase [Candidatus Neomarinimicrobiota bacterium]|tara:strand:- start:421 stop:963 length:543 start_codon:yes stop_codon:yes gene_type:complete